MRQSHHIKMCMHTSDHDSETTFYDRQDGMMHPNQFYGPFESGAPLATLEDMERRMEAVMFGAELTNMIRVHIHVVSAGLRGCDQDLLFEVVCSDFATKPIKTVIRISQGNTCVEPGSSPTLCQPHLGTASTIPSIHSWTERSPSFKKDGGDLSVHE